MFLKNTCHLIGYFIFAIGIMACSHYAESKDFPKATVRIIHPPDGRPCTLFNLNGIEDVGSPTPGTSWIAIPNSSIAYKEFFAILLTAKVTGQTVVVHTNDIVVTACGHVQATSIELN
jgi:hypothetical protein